MRRGAEGAIVLSAVRFVGQHAVRLGQGSGPSGRHLLKLLAEMMNFVRMVERDLRAERALDLFGWRRGSDLQHVIMVFHHTDYFLNSAMLAAGSSRRPSRPWRSSRSRRRFGFFTSTALRAQ